MSINLTCNTLVTTNLLNTNMQFQTLRVKEEPAIEELHKKIPSLSLEDEIKYEYKTVVYNDYSINFIEVKRSAEDDITKAIKNHIEVLSKYIERIPKKTNYALLNIIPSEFSSIGMEIEVSQEKEFATRLVFIQTILSERKELKNNSLYEYSENIAVNILEDFLLDYYLKDSLEVSEKSIYSLDFVNNPFLSKLLEEK